jgi:drug/metabolite transporter (DMT)-like permease
VPESKPSLLPYLAFVGLALIWGASFLFIKIAVQDMSPTVLVLFRSASGLVALAIILRLTGRPLFSQAWKTLVIPFVIMAVTNGLIPWTLIAWGEEHVTSGLASILNSTTTLWTAVLIYWVIPSERPSAINYGGVALGLAGVVILVLPDLTAHGVSGNFFGALAVTAAALSYAVNALYQRRRLRHLSAFEVSFGQLVATTLLAAPLAAPAIPHVHVALVSIAAVVALGAAGTGIAYLLYYYVMNTLGAVTATGVTLAVPVTAVFWGALLLHEALSLSIVIGMAVILAGILLTNFRRTRPQPAVARDSAAA